MKLRILNLPSIAEPLNKLPISCLMILAFLVRKPVMIWCGMEQLPCMEIPIHFKLLAPNFMASILSESQIPALLGVKALVSDSVCSSIINFAKRNNKIKLN